MDLKKFKLISAILLAGALLFLSVILIVNKNQADNLPFSAAEDLSTLFAARGVTLPADTIPLRREKLPVYSIPSIDGTEAQGIAETVASSVRVAANLTEDGYMFRLDNGGIFEISKTLFFSYNEHNAPTDEAAVSLRPLDDAKAEADALISHFTAHIEYDDSAVCNYVLTKYLSAEGFSVFEFELRLNGLEVADNYLTVCLDESGNLLSANGKYAFMPLKKENGFRYYDIINVLKAELDYISQNGNPGTAIESIEACYVMEPSSDGRRVMLVPAWKISYENGTVRLHESVWSE